jgi:hypothetical protein
MSFYHAAGRALEVLGMTVVAAALLAGMGLAGGEPSMAKEMLLLGVGGCIFTFGWWIDQRIK